MFSIINTFIPNTVILSASVNQNFTDIASGLSDCLTRDGQAGMTAVLKLTNGTSGAPALSATADTATGLYFPATGVLGLVANALGIKVNSEIYAAQSAVVSAGGTGYAVGDTITETGGTAVTNAVFTVATISGSAVATVTATVPGIYTAKPSNPVAQGSTSGGGSGCTLTITWNDPGSADYRLAITNLSNALLWTSIGASSFVSGLMAKANGYDFAVGIGAANLVAAISGSFIIPPAGYLTPTSNTPIILSDVTAATTIYWTPYRGNGCPIYNGSAFVNTTSAQLSADLTAGAQVSGGIYDVYKFLVAGVVTLGFSPSWSAGTSGSVAAGSCARGTSTGGTALTNLQGIQVNTVAMTMNNGATTYSIGANLATYLGSIYVNSTAGQVNCYRGYGQSRVWGIWNNYNRANILLKAGDGTASWTYSTATIRASNGSANNSVSVFCGLAEEQIDSTFVQAFTQSANTTGVFGNAIGWNSTTTQSGSGISTNFQTVGGGSSIAGSLTVGTATWLNPPALGLNKVNCLEKGESTSTDTWSGTEANMILKVAYRG